MHHWLDVPAAQNCPQILVTVAKVVGSGPREAGAKMRVTSQHSFDTIGGGHLELRAIEIARQMLALPDDSLAAQRRLERFPLGPALGQCCGGVVHLAFERLTDERNLSEIRQRLNLGQDSWRLLALDAADAVALFDQSASQLSGAQLAAPLLAQLTKTIQTTFATQGTQLLLDANGQRYLLDACLADTPHLMLFGAGHVGTAIVRALAELPCRITWVDEREDMFPAVLPRNVTVEATDSPEALIDCAPAGVSFLVLTHSHLLDQHLTDHILRRNDFAWFGLIGSHTKRMQFEHRLRERGVTPQSLERMVCPIGLPGIRGKQPAVIAASIAAQLLQVWEQLEQDRQAQQQAQQQAQPPQSAQNIQSPEQPPTSPPNQTQTQIQTQLAEHSPAAPNQDALAACH